MDKKIMVPVVVGVIALAIGFFGGMQYGKTSATTATQDRQFARQGGQGGGGNRAGFGGGATAGKVLSKDAASLTVQMNSGSKIVFYSASTKVSKTTDGSLADVVVGSQIFVSGTANPDGSVTAQTIQLR